jgi:hypothetical protein
MFKMPSLWKPTSKQVSTLEIEQKPLIEGQISDIADRHEKWDLTHHKKTREGKR